MPQNTSSSPNYAYVITANHLITGEVVYVAQDQTWTPWIQHALTYADDTQMQAALTLAQSQTETVVGVYSAKVQITDTGIETTHFREAFRVTGPSNYAHGKQQESLFNV